MDFFSLLIVLLISLPIFYVWGIISFIHYFTKGRKERNQVALTDRKQFLIAAIDDLKKELAKNPDKKLAELLTQYQNELISLYGDVSQLIQPAEIHQVEHVSNHTQTPHSEASFQNWYKDNSINLLLYIGAFLIVVSASIYVGLPGASGASKGLVINLLTLLFLGSGLGFYRIPRVKTAGAAFTAIGALLIPITGLGWYNFVFKYTDVSFGTVWLLASLVGLFVYIILARYFKSIFYSYITGFSTLSFFLAFIRMQGLQSDFYILGAIISSLMLLSISIYLQRNPEKKPSLFLEPFTITANITLPVAIVYDLYLTTNAQVTLESTVSVFLGCLFYALSYTYFRKTGYIFASQILFTLGLIYFGVWQKVSTLDVLYLISISLSINLYLVYYFQKHSMKEEATISSIFSIVKTLIILIYAQGADIAPIHLLIFANISIIVGIALALIRKNIYYLTFSSIFLAIALYILCNELFHFGDRSYIVGIIDTVVATGWYTGAVLHKKEHSTRDTFGLSCAFFFALSIFFIGDEWRYQLFNTAILTVIIFSAAYQFSKKEFVYLGSASVAFTLLCFLKLIHVHIQYYPLIYTALSYALYFIGTAAPHRSNDPFKISGLIGALVAPFLFVYYTVGDNLYDYSSHSPFHSIEYYSLIASYATTVIYAFDAFSRKSRPLAYLASAIGLATYLWQINFLGITEMQYYTFVTGLYFFSLAYIQRKRHNDSLKTLFDIIAAFFLVVPTWSESYGTNGATYAFILGAIGVCYVVFSITYLDKWYRYAGILAIVLAVISQSKWAVIGLAGLAFLGFAFYLLVHRKEATPQSNDS